MNDLKPSIQNRIELAELFRIALQAFKERPGLIIGGTTLLNLLPFILVGIPLLSVLMALAVTGATAGQGMDIKLVGKIILPILISAPVFLCVYSVFRVGWISICLKIIGKEPVDFSEFRSNLPRFWPFLGLQMLVLLCVGAGTLFFIIPGIFLAVRLAFAPYLMIDRNLGPLEAMQESWNLVSGFSWQILLINLAGSGTSSIANVIPFVGLLLMPMSMSYYDLLITAAYKARSGTLNH